MGHHSVLLEKSTGRVLTFGAAALGHWSDALWQFHRLGQFACGFHTGARGTSTGCGGIDGGDVDRDRLLQYVRDVSRWMGVLLWGESVSAVRAQTCHHPCADAAYIGTRWEAHRPGRGPLLSHPRSDHRGARSYSMGCSEDGQRGVDADNERPLPVAMRVVVPDGDSGPIVEVAAGLNHSSLARDDAGRVWAWGSNE